MIPPADIEILANEIIRLSMDENLRKSIGEAAKEYALNNLSWDKHIQEFKSLIVSN